jgi:hypothetical protein
MMRATIFLRVSFLSILALLMRSDLRAAERHEATGRVIAKDAYLGLPRTSSTANVELFILRIDERVKSRGAWTRFIKVRYEDYANQHPLPTDLLDGKKRFQFLLKRDRGCDQVVSEGLILPRGTSNELPKSGTFVILQSADVNDIPPLKSTLPCFVLRPGGAKPVVGQP